LRHQTMDKVQKHNSFSTNTPSSESYRNYFTVWWIFNELHGKIFSDCVMWLALE